MTRFLQAPTARALLISAVFFTACRSAPRSTSSGWTPGTVGTELRRVRLAGSGWGDFWTVEMIAGTAGTTGRMVIAADSATVDTLAADYRCRMRRAVSTADHPWACVVPFPDGAPEWGELMARLERAGAGNPPPSPPSVATPAAPGTITVERCNHEAPWVLTWTEHASGRTVRTQEPCGTSTAAWAHFVATVGEVQATIHATAMGQRRWRELHP